MTQQTNYNRLLYLSFASCLLLDFFGLISFGFRSSTVVFEQQHDISSDYPSSSGSSLSSSPPPPPPSSSSNIKKGRRRAVTTLQGIQGFHLPLDLLEWNLLVPPSPGATILNRDDGSSSSATSTAQSSSIPSRRNFTKTVCTRHILLAPAKAIKNMFTGVPDWEIIPKSTETDDPACSNSRIRVLWEGYKNTSPNGMLRYRQLLRQHHTTGEQLTTQILGARINKESLWTSIQNHQATTTSTNNNDNNIINKKEDHRALLNLKDSLPTTTVFNSTKSCKNFCDDEWLKSQRQPQPQNWIWKPTNKIKGTGIVLIGETNGSKDGVSPSSSLLESLESCYRHCKEEGGENLLAQEVADTMLLPDGRKFDIRSHILVANVDPLIVFTGADVVRICAEPMNATNPEPFPGIPTNSSWNPFQQVCNVGMGKKHPIPGIWSYLTNTGPLARAIPDEDVRSRVLSKIDQHHYALVELLHRRWEGEVGMFQVLAADYLVDNSGKIWLLELNDQPGYPVPVILGGIYPNPWGDIFDIEWTILETYNQHYRRPSGDGSDSSNSDGNNSYQSSTWKRILKQRLSELELETLRMIVSPLDNLIEEI